MRKLLFVVPVAVALLLTGILQWNAKAHLRTWGAFEVDAPARYGVSERRVASTLPATLGCDAVPCLQQGVSGTKTESHVDDVTKRKPRYDAEASLHLLLG
jgi:hypothetical protein